MERLYFTCVVKTESLLSFLSCITYSECSIKLYLIFDAVLSIYFSTEMTVANSERCDACKTNKPEPFVRAAEWKLEVLSGIIQRDFVKYRF